MRVFYTDAASYKTRQVESTSAALDAGIVHVDTANTYGGGTTMTEGVLSINGSLADASSSATRAFLGAWSSHWVITM